jgi:hypothetical protein
MNPIDIEREEAKESAEGNYIDEFSYLHTEDR